MTHAHTHVELLNICRISVNRIRSRTKTSTAAEVNSFISSSYISENLTLTPHTHDSPQTRLKDSQNLFKDSWTTSVIQNLIRTLITIRT